MSNASLSDLSHRRRDHSAIIKDSRSQLIRKLRITLPVIAVCILFSVLVFSDRKDPIEARPIEEIIPHEMGKNELINAKFETQDQNERPFSITSERAFQEDDNSNNINLEKPKAYMRFDDGTHISLKGENGIYQQEEQLLHLEGDVRFLHNDGYEILTTTVDINIEEQTAVSNTPVTGKGPTGDITASGLIANGQTAVFIFKGPATLTLTQEIQPETPEEKNTNHEK